MSGDALSGTGLIAAAKTALAALDAGTPPASSSEARFISLMIARAHDVAARDQALAPAIAAHESAIVKEFGAGKELDAVITAIRNGALDANDALYDSLHRLAVLRLKATKPEALAPEDRG